MPPPLFSGAIPGRAGGFLTGGEGRSVRPGSLWLFRFAHLYGHPENLHRRVDTQQIASRLLERIQSDLLEPEGELTAESDLFAAGLDSMAIMQLTLIVEQEFGVRLPESLISRNTFETALKLAGVVAELKRA